MKKQTGHIKLEATIDNLTYYKRNGEYLVKKKSAVSRTRLKYSPQYAAFRQHQRDFGQAAKGGKLIRKAFAPLVQEVADWNCVGRLTKTVLNVIQSDLVNPQEQRRITDGNLELLRGFEFNAGCTLSQVLNAPFSLREDINIGLLSLEIPGFIPSKQLRSPKEASHFQVVMGVGTMDFSGCTYLTAFAETAWMPVDGSSGNTISLVCNLSKTVPNPMFVVAGVRFFQAINGIFEPIFNAGYQALSLVMVLKSGQVVSPVNPTILGAESSGMDTVEKGVLGGTSGPDASGHGTISYHSNASVPLEKTYESCWSKDATTVGSIYVVASIRGRMLQLGSYGPPG